MRLIPAEVLRFRTVRTLLVSFSLLLPSLSEIAVAASAPTISITSPSTGSSLSGKVTITGLVSADPSGSAKINEVGIKVEGLETALNLSYTEFNLAGATNNQQTSWSFDPVGEANRVWTPPVDGKLSISFDTTSWPNQKYRVTLFAKDSNQRSAASRSIEFSTRASAPTISITSPSTGSSLSGKVTITGLVSADPSGSAKINEVGIKVEGLETALNLSYTEFNLAGATNNQQTSWSFDPVGEANRVWTPPVDGKLSISFDTTSWPNQKYRVTLFAKDSNQRSAASRSIEYVKPVGPITTLTTRVTCEGEPQVTVKNTYSISCTSRETLPEVPLELQQKKNGNWVTFSTGNILTGNNSYTYQFIFNNIGPSEVRVISKGLMKQLSPYFVNIQVKPFISNSIKVSVKAQPAQSNPTSQKSSGSKTPSGQTTTKPVVQRIPAPAIVGLGQKYIEQNLRSFPGIRFAFSTDLHHQYSVACQLAGQATVVGQNPRAGTLIPKNSTVWAYLDC